MNLRLRRLDPETDRADYLAPWRWMGRQPDLYRENHGYGNFAEFLTPPFPVVDFLMEGDDGQPIAFASFLTRKPGACQFCLIAPERPPVRAVLRVLRELQRRYFEEMGGWYLFICFADGVQFERAVRMARMMRWRQTQPRYFEMTLIDYLRERDVTKSEDAGTSQNAV